MIKIVSHQSFCKNRDGSVLVTFTLILSLLMLVVAGSIDYLTLSYHKEKLQSGVDAAALAAAKELKLSNMLSSQSEVEDILTDVSKAILKSNLKKPENLTDFNLNVDIQNRTVTVSAALKNIKPLLSNIVNSMNTIVATASAQSMGSTPLCALATGDEKKGAFILNNSAKLTGNGCTVYSNSDKKNSISIEDNAKINASMICSVGGIEGNISDIDPSPITDCPVLDDPLADRIEPDSSVCDFDKISYGKASKGKKEKISGSIKNGKEAITKEIKIDTDRTANKHIILSPGVYCGGLEISSGVNIFLRPGIYVMKDGPLNVTGNASLSGENVGFFFKGDKSVFYFGQGTSISLTAPKDGVMASLLFFEARGEKNKRKFAIFSDDARVLLGTIYLPLGELYIDGFRPVADLSAYTVVIAGRVSLFSGPQLVLNTDYSATDIPVPTGVLNANGVTRLTK